MLVPQAGTKKFKFDLVVERQAELLNWLKANVTDLDQADFQEETRQLQSNLLLGETTSQREWMIERAKKWVTVKVEVLVRNGKLQMSWYDVR